MRSDRHGGAHLHPVHGAWQPTVRRPFGRRAHHATEPPLVQHDSPPSASPFGSASAAVDIAFGVRRQIACLGPHHAGRCKLEMPKRHGKSGGGDGNTGNTRGCPKVHVAAHASDIRRHQAHAAGQQDEITPPANARLRADSASSRFADASARNMFDQLPTPSYQEVAIDSRQLTCLPNGEPTCLSHS